MKPHPPQTQATLPEPIDESLLDGLSSQDYEALQWAVRVDNGLSPAQQVEFDAWLAQSPGNQAAYASFSGASQAFDSIPPVGKARLGASLVLEKAAQASAASSDASALPRAAAEALARNKQAAPAARLSKVPRQFAAVAMLVLAVLAGSGWWGWDRWQNQSTFSRDYATRKGQNLTVELPDGSRLLLDTATEASVALYRNRREVKLPEGQVLFQVKGDKARPFDVWAGQSRITVVGTKFSVRYTPSMGSQAVQVSVQEGHVRVSRAGAEAGDAVAELEPGQAVSADARGVLGKVVAMPVTAIATWQDQRLNFENVPLGQVLAELERYGPSGLSVRDEKVASLPVTASVDLHQVGTFAAILKEVLPVRLVRDGDTLEILGR